MDDWFLSDNIFAATLWWLVVGRSPVVANHCSSTWSVYLIKSGCVHLSCCVETLEHRVGGVDQ